MTCVIRKHGETQPGETTLTLIRDALALVVKHVPAQVCDTCGEAYVDEATTVRLFQAVEEAAGAGVQVEAREYVVA